MKPTENPKPLVTRSGRFGDSLTLRSAGLYVALLTGYHGRRAGELTLDAGSLSANVDPRGNRPFRRMVTLRQLDEIILSLQSIRDAARKADLIV